MFFGQDGHSLLAKQALFAYNSQMDSIFGFFQDSVSFAVPMIVLLGLLIFVHELGHFLVAKYYKVKVEVFSLGFGPKIFKFKRGDTTYAISAIPLGGYVKMFGDDPTAPVSGPDRDVAFNHKPVGQRIAVVLAGPLMNFFFALVVFMIVGLIGERAFAPKLGDIKPETLAYQSGLRSGDKVTAVNGSKVETWDQLNQAIEANPETSISLQVERDGQSTEVTATPKRVENKNVMSWADEVGAIEGVSLSARSSIIGVESPKSPAGVAGIKPGDMIVSVNDQKIDKWRELLSSLEANTSTKEIKFGVRRDYLTTDAETAPIEFLVQIPSQAQSKKGLELLTALGMENPEVYLLGFDQPKLSLLGKAKNSVSSTQTVPMAPAERAGLKVGDKLVAIDGQKVENFEQVSAIVRGHKDETQAMKIAFIRDGERQEVTVQPNVKERMNPNFKEEKRFEIGIRPMIVDAVPATTIWKSSNPVAALERGFGQTMKWTSITILGFVRLFENKVSAKNIGGFFSIGQMAQKSWEIGISQFLNVMAIISLNLFILNLLPVPVLDGGHLVFFTIEAIKGAPLSLRKLEIAQQVGMVLLLSLMVFALFNDFSRMFGGS